MPLREADARRAQLLLLYQSRCSRQERLGTAGGASAIRSALHRVAHGATPSDTGRVRLKECAIDDLGGVRQPKLRTPLDGARPFCSTSRVTTREGAPHAYDVLSGRHGQAARASVAGGAQGRGGGLGGGGRRLSGKGVASKRPAVAGRAGVRAPFVRALLPRATSMAEQQMTMMTSMNMGTSSCVAALPIARASNCAPS